MSTRKPQHPIVAPLDALANLAALLAAASLCGMALILAWQVFGRYVLNDSPGWTEPVALTLMSLSALCGAAIGVRRETHFSFPTFQESLPAPGRRILKTLSRLLACGFGVALAYYGGALMADSWDVPLAGAPVPEGLSFAGLLIGGALIAVFAIERAILGDPPAGSA